MSHNLLQYLSEECSVGSLSEFKSSLENRSKVRLELIEDLEKKRMLVCHTLLYLGIFI